MLPRLFDLRGRTALVTGGSKGIGKAVARGYAEAGADVMICARRAEELRSAAAEIAAGLDVRVEYQVTDLPMKLLDDTQKQLFAERTAVKRWGHVSDMVGPVLLLSSQAGAFITGTVILADGGLICRTFD